ncbi:DsbA family protein [Caulobacter henricii]|uniref:Disulfide bond formation protein DsbA n=1 Tax=Caulobacter henricii TaxID=69395 RepID=A0A0P0NZB7_9CAUL|nr:DsbA family protein [Caulobacter henricii]ALL13503.1 disulfide bond formation protein DsbA [Caulobacter henricii]
MSPFRRPGALVLSFALSGILLGACAPAKADKEFGDKVRAYLLEHPEVLLEVSAKLEQKQATKAAEAGRKALDQFRQAIERDPRDFVANPNGTITVTEFFDYRCGYCRLAAPEILKLIAENPDVRFVFKDFVIFGRDSEAAARLMLGAKAQGKSLLLHRALMAEKSLDEASAYRIAAGLGIDVAKARSLGASAGVTQHLADTHALAQSLAIEGTPAYIVGDTIIPGADIQALKLAIAKAKAAALKRA